RGPNGNIRAVFVYLDDGDVRADPARQGCPLPRVNVHVGDREHAAARATVCVGDRDGRVGEDFRDTMACRQEATGSNLRSAALGTVGELQFYGVRILAVDESSASDCLARFADVLRIF